MTYERVIRSCIYLLSRARSFRCLSVMSAIVVARWLNPQDYAVMALAGIVLVMVGLVCELGPQKATAHHPGFRTSARPS